MKYRRVHYYPSLQAEKNKKKVEEQEKEKILGYLLALPVPMVWWLITCTVPIRDENGRVNDQILAGLFRVLRL